MPKKHTVKLTKASRYSYTVIIPKEIVEKYGWREKQKMTVGDRGQGKVMISDWPARKALPRMAGGKKK